MAINGLFWELVDSETGEPFALPGRRADFRGEVDRIKGGQPPHKPHSTGTVQTDSGQYYPTVYGLEWRLTADLARAAQLMRRRGGSFAAALGDAYMCADAYERWRLVDAFDDVFARALEALRAEQELVNAQAELWPQE